MKKGSNSLRRFKAEVFRVRGFSLLLALLLASCGGNGGESNESNQQSFTAPASPQYRTTPVLSGKGQITNLTLSGNTLIWGGGNWGKGIWKYTKGNTAAELLAPKLLQPSNLIVRGNYFYWVEVNETLRKKFLYRTSLDGTQTTLLREGAPVFLETISADDEAVYWKTHVDPDTSRSIERIPFDGSTPQKIYTTSRSLMGFTVGGNHIYWLENAETANPWEAKLYRVNKTGGSPETVCASISDPIETTSLTHNSDSIFVGTYGKLLKIPAAGGTPTVLDEGANIEPYSIVANQGVLYWINNNRDASYGHEWSIASQSINGGDITTIAADVKGPGGLLTTAGGLCWTESDPAYTTNIDMYRVLKRRSWTTGAVVVVANGIYISSYDVDSNYIYVTEFDRYTGYAEIARIPLAGGSRDPLIGGLNKSPFVLSTTPTDLVIGDVCSLKKVSIAGGVTETLLINGRFEIADIREKDGVVFFSSSGVRHGIYKIPLEGGSYVSLAEESGLYGSIISVQDGFVYYLLGQSNGWPTREELRRVPINGGNSESVFVVPDGNYMDAVEGIGTVYMSQWIWNDQYKLIKYDISTGKSTQLLIGAYRFKGYNRTSVFLEDLNGTIYRIPKDGGDSTLAFYAQYPLVIDGNWVRSGENFYFSVSYLDEGTGYHSELELLEQVN